MHEREGAAQRELLYVLRLVDAGKMAVSDRTRRPSASTIEAITELLDGGDYYPHVPPQNEWEDENAGPIRAVAWPLLVQAGGLAQLSGTRLQLTKIGRQALSEPAAATIRTLWNKWLKTAMFDELARIDCVKGQNGKGKHGLTAASSRRDAIAGSLAECAAGRWIATDELLRYMEASDNVFAVSRDAWDLYIGDPEHGSLGYDGSGRVLDQHYTLALMLEYAATLGVLDVALIPPAGARGDFRGLWGMDEFPFFNRYDGLMYFRITPLGAWCLDISDYQSGPVEVKPVIRILPNLEIVAASPTLEQSDRLALNAYAVPVSDFVWRIDFGKLLAASEEGTPVHEVREFLTARSGAPSRRRRGTVHEVSRPWACAPYRVRRSRSHRSDRQRHQDPETLPAGRGAAPGGSSLVGGAVPPRFTAGGLRVVEGRDARTGSRNVSRPAANRPQAAKPQPTPLANARGSFAEHRQAGEP